MTRLLSLSEYRTPIQLDVPFHAPALALEEIAQREMAVDQLRLHLETERGDSHSPPGSYVEKRRLLQALLTIRPPRPLPSWFHTELGQLLEREKMTQPQTQAQALPRLGPRYAGAARLALWQGDITTLEIDAIVNAANAELLGCFQPFHACIDNAIHGASGPRLREDCHTLMQLQGRPEPTGQAKITRAYHLPARYVLHTVGPIIERDLVRAGDEQQLARCYRACLDLAAGVTSIRSLAFCGISTGVYGFPAARAARIAIDTVQGWLRDHPQRLELVVFDVFSARGHEIYAELLGPAQP